jgi:GcrA cell cycle regulator
MRDHRDQEWTGAENATLRQLWDEGHSTAAIGRMMNRTKNSIVGKAHRTGLSRPSPIKGVLPPRAPRAKRPVGNGAAPLPAGACLPPMFPTVAQNILRIIPTPFAGGCAPSPATNSEERPDPSTTQPGTTFRPRASHPCSFPIGEPRTRGFRYCDEPARAGRSYCDTHHQATHAPRKPRPAETMEARCEL